MKRARPEQQIQKAIFDHLCARAAPGAFAWHPFSGGYRKPIEAAIYKSLGARAGLPDVMVLHEGRLYCLELKKEGGRPTEIQLATIAALEAAGAFTCIAEGLDQALAILEAWQLLVGKSQSSIAQKRNATLPAGKRRHAFQGGQAAARQGLANQTCARGSNPRRSITQVQQTAYRTASQASQHPAKKGSP